MMSERRGFVFAGLAVLAWSTVAAAFKIALRSFSSASLLLVVSAVSTLVLGLIVVWRTVFSGVRHPVGSKTLLRSGLLGFMNPFIYYLLIFAAYERLLAQVAQPLNQVWGILLAVASAWRFGRRISSRQWVGMGVSFVGVLVLVTKGRLDSLQVDSPLGVVLALSSAFVWAFYWLSNMDDDCDPVWRMFLNCGFGFLFTLVYCLITGNLPHGVEAVGWGAAVYIGFFEIGITTVLWLMALRGVKDTTRVSGLIYLVPFISLIFISQVAEEAIHLSSVLGLVLVIGGQLLIQRKNRLEAKGTGSEGGRGDPGT